MSIAYILLTLKKLETVVKAFVVIRLRGPIVKPCLWSNNKERALNNYLLDMSYYDKSNIGRVWPKNCILRIIDKFKFCPNTNSYD